MNLHHPVVLHGFTQMRKGYNETASPSSSLFAALGMKTGQLYYVHREIYMDCEVVTLSEQNKPREAVFVL